MAPSLWRNGVQRIAATGEVQLRLFGLTAIFFGPTVLYMAR
jgi:uncharacterized protein YjeT (DUF2065 family)